MNDPLTLRAQRSHPLDAILRASSVAIVGASQDPTKRGHHAVRSLLEGGFAGAVYPVHPAGGDLFGLRVWRSLEEIDGQPELALICTPAGTVPQLIEECGRKGIRGAVVLAVGFGEAGSAGVRLDAALRGAATRAGVRVVGPNTSGIMNAATGLNLIGARNVRAGRIALLVQSGNIALSVMTEALRTSDEGFSVVVGVGNEADVRYDEHLDWLDADDATGVVLVHAEGFRDVRSFLAAARRVTRRKPLVLLAAGRSERGRAAARSHTGALSGAYAVLRDVVRQLGVIEVSRSDELFPVGLTLVSQPPARAGAGVAILSDGGGHGTLGADELGALNTRLASLGPATRTRLRALLGTAAAVTNPIDLAGAADRAPSIFADALQILLDDQDVGAVLVVGLFGGYGIRFAAELTAEEEAAAERMAQTASATGVTLVVHTLYAAESSAPLRRLRAAGVPVIGSLEVACRCIAAACERRALLDRPEPTDIVVMPDPAPAVFGPARAETRDALLEPEVRELVAAYGVPVVTGAFCASEADVAVHAARLAQPLAVKLVSSTISHKAAAGGVALHITGADAAVAAYRRIVCSAEAWAAAHGVAADVRGVLLTAMLERPLLELLIGTRRDTGFGPVITIGAGGGAVEALGDVAIRLLPVDSYDVTAMLAQTRTGRTLTGAACAAALAACTRLVLNLSDCFLANRDLAELELNPVFLYETNAVAVDARAFLAAAHEALEQVR